VPAIAASRGAGRSYSSTARGVTSDRRVGPSATFLTRSSSTAWKSRAAGLGGLRSDAFGGVIYARTRRIDPARRWPGAS